MRIFTSTGSLITITAMSIEWTWVRTHPCVLRCLAGRLKVIRHSCRTSTQGCVRTQGKEHGEVNRPGIA